MSDGNPSKASPSSAHDELLQTSEKPWGRLSCLVAKKRVCEVLPKSDLARHAEKMGWVVWNQHLLLAEGFRPRTPKKGDSGADWTAEFCFRRAIKLSWSLLTFPSLFNNFGFILNLSDGLWKLSRVAAVAHVHEVTRGDCHGKCAAIFFETLLPMDHSPGDKACKVPRNPQAIFCAIPSQRTLWLWRQDCTGLFFCAVCPTGAPPIALLPAEFPDTHAVVADLQTENLTLKGGRGTCYGHHSLSWKQVWRVAGRVSNFLRTWRISLDFPERPQTSQNFPRQLPRASLTVDLVSNPGVPQKFPRSCPEVTGTPHR